MNETSRIYVLLRIRDKTSENKFGHFQGFMLTKAGLVQVLFHLDVYMMPAWLLKYVTSRFRLI